MLDEPLVGPPDPSKYAPTVKRATARVQIRAKEKAAHEGAKGNQTAFRGRPMEAPSADHPDGWKKGQCDPVMCFSACHHADSTILASGCIKGFGLKRRLGALSFDCLGDWSCLKARPHSIIRLKCCEEEEDYGRYASQSPGKF